MSGTDTDSFAGENIAAKSGSLSPADSMAMWREKRVSHVAAQFHYLWATNALQTCMTGNVQSISVIAKPLDLDRRS